MGKECGSRQVPPWNRLACPMPIDWKAVFTRNGGIMNPNPDMNDTSPRREGVSQDVRILVWNVRGAGKKYFLQKFKGHV